MIQLKKNTPWLWSTSCEKYFSSLKRAFITAPILHHFDLDRRCIVDVDSSDWAHGVILSQHDNSNILHPIAYFSVRLTPAKINYEIYDKELLAVDTASIRKEAALRACTYFAVDPIANRS